MPRKTHATAMRTVRQDLSLLVGVLLLLTVVVTALTSLGDGAELFGLGDDLHAVAGWSMVILTVLHTVLCWGLMVNHVKRRLRNRLGVGGVIQRGVDGPGDE
jgi:hypothetical protein